MVFKRSALGLAITLSIIAAPFSYSAEKSTPSPSASSQAKPLSLIEAYEAALIHDPLYRVAIQERIAGTQYAVLGRAALLPQVAYSN